jgi:tetratricopeptide (TPR) repeat protein
MRFLWLLGVGLFLAAILWLVQAKEPYFWYSAHDYYERAQEAEARGAKTEALEWARQAYRRQPTDANYGSFLGWRYLETGQPQAALQIFRQVGEQQPRAAAAFKGQAQALEQLGERPAALALLDSFLANNPDNVEILQFAADLAGRQVSNRPQALNYYRRLYKLNPTDTSVRRQLLNLLLAAGNFAEAIPIQEAETADFPDDSAALHQLALLHYWRQDYQAAVPIYQRLLEIEAENQALRLEAAKTADAAHEVDKALSHYLRLYTREPYNKEYALPLARLWSQKGNHTEAATVLAALMKDRPDADLRRQYALEHLLAGDYSQAYRAYRAAWEAGDTHQETILNLARLAAQQRHFHVAAQFWDEARRRQLVRRDLSWEAALTYSYAQRYPEAVEVLKTADRQEPQVLLFLGQMHFYQKHWGQAAHYYRTYLEKYPHEVKVRAQLAEVLSYDTETLGESTQQLAEALKEQDDPRQRLKLAALLLEQAQALSEDKKTGHREEAGKKWAEAAAELQKFQEKPGEPELRREAARLYLWLGDLDKALEHYEQYLATNPADRQAHLEKARVLIYLQRGREAMEGLRRLPAPKSPGSLEPRESKEKSDENSDSPENAVTQKQVLDQPDNSGADREMLVVAVEAALATKDWRQADQWALKLFSLQLTDKPRLPKDWPEAIRRVRLEKTPQPLSLEERTWIARTLVHQPDLEQHQELV